MDALNSSNSALLEELSSLEMWAASRKARELQSQARTPGGYPRVRPQDCARVNAALQKAVSANADLLRTGDAALIARIDRLLDELTASDLRFYEGELFALKMIRARVRLLINDGQGLRDLVKPYADRPYMVENGLGAIIEVMNLDGRASLLLGEVEDLPDVFFERFLLVARISLVRAVAEFEAFAPFLSIKRSAPGRWRLLNVVARIFVRLDRFQWGPAKYAAIVARKLLLLLIVPFATLCAVLWRGIENMLGRHGVSEVFVTRAQGGIGDIIMMTPGLRALAKRTGRKARFAIDRQFFPIFKGNPHVDVLDIAGEPLPLAHNKWKNLTNCPAALYESRTAPNIRRGRVRVFAGGMGVGWQRLKASGLTPELHVSEEDAAFCREFLRTKGWGASRPLIGVQPFSREIYREHPRMEEIIHNLAGTYDVVIFHHVDSGLPTGDRIISTAGMSLERSLALVAFMDVMVAVDSAFLHAPAAFGVPLVGVFGPTDGLLRSGHHSEKIILDRRDAFPCAPCWRNEDTPCRLTGQTGISPCIASIAVREVHDAVSELLGRNGGRGGEMKVST